MEKIRSCSWCLKSWKCFYVSLSVLLLVNNVISEPVRFKVRSRLHEQQVLPRQEQDSIESQHDSRESQQDSRESQQDSIESQVKSTESTPAASQDGSDDASSSSSSQQQSASQSTTPSTECDLCASLSLTKEQLDYVHIEMAKQRILDKLRMTQPPNITQPIPALPHSLVKQGGTFVQDIEEAGTEAYYAETEQVILLTDSVSVCEDDAKAVCFSLPIKKQIGADQIRSLKFHVYRKSGGHLHTPATDTLELFERTENGDRFLTKEVVPGDPHSRSWLPFKIPKRLMNFVRTNEANSSNSDNANSVISKHLKLKCNQCENVVAFMESSVHKAYLEIKTAEPRSHTRRSTIECQPGLDQCCKVRLYVSFETMGWDGWILSPEGYYANYCAGSCRGRHEQPAYQHTRIMMGLSDEQQQTATNNYHPCCSPTRLSQLSLLYMEADGQLIKKNLPNMTVETCGCA